MSSCRTCKAPKWRGDPCPTCGAGLPQSHRTSHTPPITIGYAHGFHEPATTTTRKAA